MAANINGHALTMLTEHVFSKLEIKNNKLHNLTKNLQCKFKHFPT